jgi:hypothetical protein
MVRAIARVAHGQCAEAEAVVGDRGVHGGALAVIFDERIYSDLIAVRRDLPDANIHIVAY